jgi:hypothetical protein
MKLIRRTLVLLVLMFLVAIAGAWWLLRGSLAKLDGEQPLPGLSDAVTVTRDALGTVRIDALSANDMARALGFVHAQERYFQMDLLRRSAAGELWLVAQHFLSIERIGRIAFAFAPSEQSKPLIPTNAHALKPIAMASTPAWPHCMHAPGNTSRCASNLALGAAKTACWSYTRCSSISIATVPICAS